MNERERKFLLLYLPKGLKKVKIQQGYLMLEGAKHLRIRITDNSLAELGFNTVKDKENKDEYEYVVPIKDGKKLMSTTEIKLKKTRYKTTFEGNNVDIDVFPDGTAWVEIEFKGKLKNLPDFCGKEVTGIKSYSNIFIAIQNSKK